MLVKVLDFEFNANGMPIDKSGQRNHGHATATAFSIDPDGTTGATFLSDNSRIVVPHSASWNEITATRIDVRVRLSSLTRRANLVEIERSVALFIRRDGVVTFAFYAPEEDPDTPQIDEPVFTARPDPSGSTDPFDTLVVTPPDTRPVSFSWDGVNTDADFAPDGRRRTVPLNQYVTISAIHDGLASMRIFVDGELSGARYDIQYAVPPLMPPGIVAIGAWPHDGRYTLRGSLDFVRVWRYDPHFAYRQFFCRPMSAEAKDCWHRILRQITGGFGNDDSAEALLGLVGCLDTAYRTFYRSVAQNGEGALQSLRAFFREYVRLWCEGDIAGDRMRELQARFLTWLQSVDPDAYSQHFADVHRCMTQAGRLGVDQLRLDLRTSDPAWSGYVELMSSLLSQGQHSPGHPDLPLIGDSE